MGRVRGVGDGGDAGEDGDDVLHAGPGLGEPQPLSSCAAGDPGGHVQQPVPQCFRFAGGELFGEGEDAAQLGDQVGRDRDRG